MPENKKVTIERTDAQKAKLKNEAGVDVNSLTYDALEDRFDQLTMFEFRHRIGKRTHAGEHESRGPGDDGRIAGNSRRMADAFKRLLNAPQVAHLIIDNRNHRGVFLSSEFVRMGGLTPSETPLARRSSHRF